MKARLPLVVLAVAASAGLASAQTSASYKLTEFAFNGGGDPGNGSFASSASYHVRLDAIGDTIAWAGLSSASNRSDGGFVGDYPPPLEVRNLVFTSKTAMAWDPEKSVGTYEVYRALLSTLPGLGYGTCFASALATEGATDAPDPSPNQGYFYLAVARNRLGEIGTKGSASNGTERANGAPCP